MSVRRHDINFILRCEQHAFAREHTVFDHSSAKVINFIECMIGSDRSSDQDEKSLFYAMLLAYLNQLSNKQLSLIKQNIVSQKFEPAPNKTILNLSPLVMGTILSFVTHKEYCRMKATCMKVEYLLDNRNVIQYSKLFETYNLNNKLVGHINDKIYCSNDIYYLRFCTRLTISNCRRHELSANLTDFLQQNNPNHLVLTKQLSYQAMWHNIQCLELGSTSYFLQPFCWFSYITSNLQCIKLTLPTLTNKHQSLRSRKVFDAITKNLTHLSNQCESINTLEQFHIALESQQNNGKNSNNDAKYQTFWFRNQTDNCKLIKILSKMAQISKYNNFKNTGFMFTDVNQLYAIFGTELSKINDPISCKSVVMSKFLMVHLKSAKKEEFESKENENINSISFNNSSFTYPNIIQLTVKMNQNQFIVSLPQVSHEEPVSISGKDKKVRIWNKDIDITTLPDSKKFNFFSKSNCNETAMNIVNSIMNWHKTLKSLIIECDLNEISCEKNLDAESLSDEMRHTFLRAGCFNPELRGTQGTFYRIHEVIINISYYYRNSQEHGNVEPAFDKVLESIDTQYIPRIMGLLNVQKLKLQFVLNETKKEKMKMCSTRNEKLAKNCAEWFGKEVRMMLTNHSDRVCACTVLYTKEKKNKGIHK